jgi:hypothetical protein
MGALFALILAAMTLAPLAGAPMGEATADTSAATGAAAEAKAAAKAQAKAGAAGSWSTSPEAAEEATAEATAEAPATPAFEAEEQVATGKFLTALEVKPILGATRGNWIAVREYEGQDLLYFTHLLAWRCGLHQIRYTVNGGPEEVLEMEPCYVDTNAPGALKADQILPYLTYPLQSVETVEVHLVYDDNSEETASFARKEVLMP